MPLAEQLSMVYGFAVMFMLSPMISFIDQKLDKNTPIPDGQAPSLSLPRIVANLSILQLLFCTGMIILRFQVTATTQAEEEDLTQFTAPKSVINVTILTSEALPLLRDMFYHVHSTSWVVWLAHAVSHCCTLWIAVAPSARCLLWALLAGTTFCMLAFQLHGADHDSYCTRNSFLKYWDGQSAAHIVLHVVTEPPLTFFAICGVV